MKYQFPFHSELGVHFHSWISAGVFTCLLVVMETKPFYVGRAETRGHVMKFMTKAFHWVRRS